MSQFTRNRIAHPRPQRPTESALPWKSALLAGSFALGAGVYLARRLVAPRMRFTNRVVVITGGSRGLGLELARKFAAEGAHVAICARNGGQLQRAVAELERRGIQVLGEVCDVTSPAQIVRFIQAIVA